MVSNRLGSLDAQSRTYELVLNRLREAISSGLLRPMEELKTDDLARELGVSRMPVREALHRLEAEGLVEMRPYRSIVVAPITTERVQHAYELIAAVEGLAARKAAERIPDEALDELAGMVEQMDAAIRGGDRSAYGTIHPQFHSRIYAWYPNERAHEIIRNLSNYVHRLRRLYPWSPERWARTMTEHRALLDALRQHDGALAEQLVRDHAMASVADLLEQIRKRPQELDNWHKGESA